MSHLVSVLIKLSKDSQVVVASHAIRAAGLLGLGLREHFATHAKEFIVNFIPKGKDRKLAVALSEAFDNFMQCTTLKEILEAIETGLKDKMCLVKKSVCQFVDRCIVKTYIDELNEIKEVILPLIAAVSEDKDTETKDAGLHALGTMRGRLGEQPLEKYFDKLIPAKKTKVEEA